MSNIKDLPGAGHNFRVTTGAGNFSKKFTSATRVGALHNLKDNKASILKVIKKNESSIRIGKFDRLRQRSAWQAVKKLEGDKLSKDDKREIKLLFKHLGSRKSDNKEKDGGVDKSQRQLAKDDSFEKERLEMKGKISRFNRMRSGGEAKLNFSSRPENLDNESVTMSGALLNRRFNMRETLFKNRLPSGVTRADNNGKTPGILEDRSGESKISTPLSVDVQKEPPSFQNL